jgi:ActR/RegA family two-component response regulator
MLLMSEAADAPAGGVTPWVLLVVDDEAEQTRSCREWEEAGFAVEVAASAREALACLKVMTPALVVIEGRLYRPVPR